MTSIQNSIPMMVAGLLGFAAAMPVAAAPGDPAVSPRAPAPPQADQPAGTTFNYLFIAGSAFHPLESATAYSYPGGGCISKTGGSSPLFTHKAVLPQGAVVRYLRLYYYDLSASNVSAYFTSYDAEGGLIEHASIASIDATGGYSTILSPLFDYEVDQYAAPINVTANLGTQNTTTLRFCGVRIAYEPSSNDLLFKDGFDLQPL